MKVYKAQMEKWYAKANSIEQMWRDKTDMIKRTAPYDYTREAKLAKAYQRYEKRMNKHRQNRPTLPRAHPKY